MTLSFVPTPVLFLLFSLPFSICSHSRSVFLFLIMFRYFRVSFGSGPTSGVHGNGFGGLGHLWRHGAIRRTLLCRIGNYFAVWRRRLRLHSGSRSIRLSTRGRGPSSLALGPSRISRIHSIYLNELEFAVFVKRWTDGRTDRPTNGRIDVREGTSGTSADVPRFGLSIYSV